MAAAAAAAAVPSASRSKRVVKKTLDMKPAKGHVDDDDNDDEDKTKVAKKAEEQKKVAQKKKPGANGKKDPSGAASESASGTKQEKEEEKETTRNSISFKDIHNNLVTLYLHNSCYINAKVKTIKFVGAIPIDEQFHEKVQGYDYKIYKEADDVYDCMLNQVYTYDNYEHLAHYFVPLNLLLFALQTNLQYNNNKYYLIQLIESLKDASYIVWMRWGRVGKTGQVRASFIHTRQITQILCSQFVDVRFFI